MDTMSPTPIGQGSHFSSMGRRVSARQALRRPPSGQQLGRSQTVPGSSTAAVTARGTTPELQAQSQPEALSALNDSSDEEIPVPMKLSALTKALLSDGASTSKEPAPAGPPAPAPAIMTRRKSTLNKSTSSATVEREGAGENVRQTRRHVRTGSAAHASSSRESSPAPRKRVVRLSTTPAGGSLQGPIRRSLSASKYGKQPPGRDRPEEKNPAHTRDPEPPDAINTPASGMRKVQIAVGSSASRARLSNSSMLSSKPDHEQHEEPASASQPQGSVSRLGSGDRGKDVDPALQSSMRVKRVGKVPGSFLSGPARRGKRRQSEEEENGEVGEGEPPASNDQKQDADPAVADSFAPYVPDFASSGSPVRGGLRKQAPRTERGSAGSLEAKSGNDAGWLESVRPASRPQLPSTHDQETEIAGSLKRPPRPVVAEMPAPNKGPGPLDRSAMGSPERKALQPLSKNTPHRPAPPPPKMTMLETATAAAGAATTSQVSKKQRVLLKVNGRSYHRVDCIGRGGTSKVYKVTAENGNIFALKRVSVENADDSTIRGYLGEIDLLKRLSKVDRVIQLFDHEMNEEKHTLSLVRKTC